MPLTKVQKKKIYEEELARFEARKRIEAEQQQKKQSKYAQPMNWAIIIGFLLMLYVVVWGKG